MKNSAFPRSVLIALLAFGCGTGGHNDDASVAPQIDASMPDSATTSGDAGNDSGMTDGGTDAGFDAEPPWIPQPALANLNFNGPVYAAVHAGNAWFFGGGFTLADMIPARRLVAVDLTGQPTGCSVESGFDDRVYRMVHVGNAVYAAGLFTTYRGQSAKHLAKIDASTCLLDTAFSPPANNGFNEDVRALATDGISLYVGGLFTMYRGQSANYIAKLDPSTGAIDTTFSPAINNGFDSDVLELIATSTDVFAAGNFHGYRGATNAAHGIARLNPTTGALVATFGAAGASSNGFDSSVTSLAVSGSTLYAGGVFTSYKGVANSANRIAKIDLGSGAIDATFSPVGANANGFSNGVSAITLVGNALFVGGNFDNYRGVTGAAHRIAKLNATSGALDATFNPLANNGFTGSVLTITSVGTSIVVGGAPLGSYRGSPELRGIAKVDATSGVLDATFLQPTGHDHAGFGVAAAGALAQLADAA